ncbi:fasciclin domain-containing protein [Hoyosella rhizosphaerae]|uniref:Fasciclin n=1 Tax=Hoyosella rhizosphaerae TaxID=1755582 RepID=A0A916UH13_9ACTN|nr:fasciclin domain-containing protein [Hoyosella rhizosphaerae]MBN4928140.1 fasciclin domain-containing protein [Hoyosella rhizosphaerae]GGC72712.1 fasciclin [Hoyosella rhizosphaerae]
MRVTSKIAAISAASALALTMAACSSDDSESTMDSIQDTATDMMPDMGGDDDADDMGDGVTTIADVFGSACDAIPQDPNDAGSLDGMVADPVATAASNNPLLTTLATAVGEADLVDTLNDTSAEYTVFAPYDPAFEALGEETLNAVLADQEQLSSILTYHVVGERLDRDGILDAGTLDTVQGGTLEITGSGDDIQVNGATILCGNIPTANATVFVIDTVMLPPEE